MTEVKHFGSHVHSEADEKPGIDISRFNKFVADSKGFLDN